MAKRSEKKSSAKIEGDAKSITVFTYAEASAAVPRKGEYATGEGLGFRDLLKSQTTEISAKKLQSNLGSFLSGMETAISGIPQSLGGFGLEEIELSLEVSAEGEIGLLGTGGKLGGKGSIKLTLKRSPQEKPAT